MYVTLHYATLRYVTLRYIALRYIVQLIERLEQKHGTNKIKQLTAKMKMSS